MLDVIKELTELQEAFEIKNIISELPHEVDIAQTTAKFPSKIYLVKGGIISNKADFRKQRAVDSEGREYIVNHRKYKPERKHEQEDEWMEVHGFKPSSKYIKSTNERVSAVVEVPEIGSDKTKISLDSHRRRQLYEESLEERIGGNNSKGLIKKGHKVNYTVYHGYDHSIGDAIEQETIFQVCRDIEEGFYYLRISVESRSWRDRNDTKDPNESAPIKHNTCKVRVGKRTYSKGVKDDDIEYTLERTSEGDIILCERDLGITDMSGEDVVNIEGQGVKYYPIKEINPDGLFTLGSGYIEDEEKVYSERGNEILQILTEYGLIQEHSEEDFKKWQAKYEQAKEVLYDNQLISIEDQRESEITENKKAKEEDDSNDTHTGR